MNDFTKEELEDLMYCVSYAFNTDHELVEKIENMIDNYSNQFECGYCHSLRHKDSPNAFCCDKYHDFKEDLSNPEDNKGGALW